MGGRGGRKRESSPGPKGKTMMSQSLTVESNIYEAAREHIDAAPRGESPIGGLWARALSWEPYACSEKNARPSSLRVQIITAQSSTMGYMNGLSQAPPQLLEPGSRIANHSAGGVA